MSNEEAIDKALGILSSLIHKDYSAGPDGFKVFKSDVYKHMGNAKKLALEEPKPLPKDWPKFT